MKVAKLCAVFFLALTAGCKLPPPKPFPIKLELRVDAGGAERHGVVALLVSDKRQYGGPGFESTIPIDGNFPVMTRDMISQGLQSEGFTIAPANSAGGRELRVDILTLRLMFHAGMLIPYQQEGVAFVLESTCAAAQTPLFVKQYSKTDWTCCFNGQTRADLERQIGSTVSIVINQMLNDKQLTQCLVEPEQGAVQHWRIP
jgi:hypothetical protein